MKKFYTTLFLCCSFSFLNADGAQQPNAKLDELKRKVCTVLPSLEGWCSREKALNFIDLILEIKPKVCVDIGVFGGSSIFPVASALKYLEDGVVIGIDPWDKLECLKHYDPINDEEQFKWWGKVDLNYVYGSYISMLKRFGLEKHCITMKLTSEKAISSISDIDLLHLDGNHSELAFTQDIQLYLPKVRPGGYIFINDSLWDETQSAIDILLDSCDVVKLIDNGNCIIFKKRA